MNENLLSGWETTLVVFFIITSGLILSIFIRRCLIKKSMYRKNTRIDGKVVIITGANAGIGKETALDLAKRGGKIYMACRNIKEGKIAMEDIKNKSGNGDVHLMHLDLSSLDSVRIFVQRFKEVEKELHILINNAGALSTPKRFTENGFESHFGVNYIGPFLLTYLLLDTMLFSAPSRIVVVASHMHFLVNFQKENLNGGKLRNDNKLYAHSKLLNILFARELSKKLQGSRVTVNSLHPGVVQTKLCRNFNPIFLRIWKIVTKPFFKSAYEGAQTQIMLAVDSDLKDVSGKYFAGCSEARTSSDAKNDEYAKWLWDTTLELLQLPDFSVVEYLSKKTSGHCSKIVKY